MTEIKQGYKKTKLGWIPEDWKVVKLGEIGEFKNGVNKSKEDFGKGSPFVNLMDVFGKTSLNRENFGLVNVTSKEIENYNLKKGDVLFVRSSVKPIGVGVTTLVEEDLYQTVYSGFLIRFRERENIIANPYKKYCFYEDKFRNSLIIRSSVSANTNINQDNLTKLVLPLPPIPEQKKIAQILSTWDKAIKKTKQLLEQKKLIKKGLMQKLFSQKLRFKDDNGNEFPQWQKKRFGEITSKFSRRNKNLIDAQVYSVTNTDGFVLQTTHFSKEVAGSDLSNYKIIKRNEFAYNPARINVGSIAYFEEEVGVISSLYVCFKTNELVLDSFFNYLLDLDYSKYQISKLGEGGVRVYLWYDLFARIKCSIPSMEEQIKIVAALDSFVAEIKTLENQLAKYEEQKKGLMQQLLTGATRVKE
ncbi:restriction endonuclease subunit S [Aureispira sp. CCB-QB1]|uniref:restriction endonuclease subunit S n=1 Tax=Aureispira sp. CCB-QB1 TaxID=1313421 RepID=UPI0007C73466|nr:restriction endonuclease subunit S [Aureispira sp. CCB-QB1]